MRTKRAPEAAAFFLLISSLTQLAGCYGVQQMNLIYPPEASAVATELSGNTEHTSSSSPSNVVVEVFDARAEKDRLGGDFDGWFQEGTILASKESATTWVNDALTYELTEAGYLVLSKGSESTNDAEIGLTVDIQKVFVTASLTYQAEVLLQATLYRESELQVTKQFEGTGSAGINIATTSKSFAKSLALALQDAITNMLVDFEFVHEP